MSADTSVRTSWFGTPRRAPDPRTTARVRLHEAETALTEFRAEVREELRLAAAAGEIPEDAVRALVDGLAEVRRGLVAHLRG